MAGRQVDASPTGLRARDGVGFAVALIVLLIGAGLRIASRPKRHFDEHLFQNVAQHIVDVGLPIDSYAFPDRPYLFFDHTPLYVYFLAGLTALGGPTVPIARGASLVFGFLTVALVFYICLRLRGRGSAFVAALLVAANPFFVTYSWFIRMEVPLCFFLVLAVWLLQTRRFLLAGLAVATAVMLKEIALAFWGIAVVYAVVRHGWRAGAGVALPAPAAIVAWLAYAATLDAGQLAATLERWGRSAVGSEPQNWRFRIGPLRWTRIMLNDVIGPVTVFASGVVVAFGLMRPSRIPPITVVPAAYSAVAVAASYLLSLKEPRFLIAVVPMLALTLGLAVDWGELGMIARHQAREALGVAPRRVRSLTRRRGGDGDPGQSL